MGKTTQKVNHSNIRGAIRQTLTGYIDDTTSLVKDIIAESAKEAAQDLRSEASSVGGKNWKNYAQSWVAKDNSDSRHVVWVVHARKPQYRVAHLLENGHVISNGSGTYGRTTARHHIAQVDDRWQEKLVKKLEEGIGGHE